jgi:hypothetical protein
MQLSQMSRTSACVSIGDPYWRGVLRSFLSTALRGARMFWRSVMAVSGCGVV